MHLSLPLHFMYEMYQVMAAPKPKCYVRKFEPISFGICRLIYWYSY